MPSLDTITPIKLPDEKSSARAAGLHYRIPKGPGIQRKRAGSGWSYASPASGVIHDAETLDRIRSLVIPPAWKEVWICSSPRGHIQAVGRDQRGRKQYKYHQRFRQVREFTDQYLVQHELRIGGVDLAVAVVILQNDLPALGLVPGERREWRRSPLPVLTGRFVVRLEGDEVFTSLVNRRSFNREVATELALQ